MIENFNMLLPRILDSLMVTDIEKINDKLKNIDNSVICVGTGGSSVVSEFATKIFNVFLGTIAVNIDARDTLYLNLKNYKNIFVCSYSGNNFGVDTALNNNLNQYILTTNNMSRGMANILTYKTSLNKEKSFISLAGTLIPMSILLSFYRNDAKDIIINMFENVSRKTLLNNDTFEVISGFDTSVSSLFIDSTFTEAGLGNVIVHDKYDFHHGRSTLSYHHKNHTLIYLKTKDDDMTRLHLRILEKQYKEIIVLESDYKDIILDNYFLTLQAMYLARSLAELQGKDLSKVKHSPLTKDLYYFEGSM